jgi:signal transduction histidine kinase
VRLRQALTNLVQNALEAMEGKGTLELAATREGGEVRFTVKDDGPGVPAAVRERIFEPFVTTKSGGSGLGLALVQRIAAAHGGRAAIDPAQGSGATFSIWVPIGTGGDA